MHHANSDCKQCVGLKLVREGNLDIEISWYIKGVCGNSMKIMLGVGLIKLLYVWGITL